MQSVVTTFLPSAAFFGRESTAEPTVRVEPDPESLEYVVARLLQAGPLSRAELAKYLRHRHVSGGLKKAIKSLLTKGLIVYTRPDTPNSRLQQYALPESRPGSLENVITRLLERGSLSRAELSELVRHKHVSGGLKKALRHLLEEGLIEYTIPEKPNSRLQRYALKKMD